jgi:ATP-dependent DNA helicase RecG
MTENQNIEYKESWRDEYLKWVAGFANAQGGKIIIGINDDGEVTGVVDYKKLMEDIPNKVITHLGLMVEVNLHQKFGRHYIEIIVPSLIVPISYHGAYYYRSGSTKQELKGTALQHFLLKRIGKTWEDVPVPYATLNDLNENTIQLFIERALQKGRVPAEAVRTDTVTLLKNLRLINEDGQLTNAALLLFGKNPTRFFVTASFKIGRFGSSDSDLLFQDIVETNIFEMADKVLEILAAKYLIRPISYKGLERMEPLEYPEPALREAILNSIIHKDHAGTWVFLRVYNDTLTIWNPGTLPDNLTIDMLKKHHSSYPRNRLIADIFFKAGYIEAWGRGIAKIIESCTEAQLPEPIFSEYGGGVEVTFLKDIYKEEILKSHGLEDRQIKALLFIKQSGRITNTEYQQLYKVSKRTATNDLQLLLEKGLIQKIGTTGKGTYYDLQRGNKGAKRVV